MRRIIIVLLAGLLFIACQPTPDHEFVVNKSEEKAWQKPVEGSDEVQLQEGVKEQKPVAAENSPEASTSDPEQPTDSALYERLGAPKAWTLETTINKVHIVAENAPVFLPEADRVPAVEARLRALTDEDVQRAVKAIFGDRQYDWYPSAVITKEYVAERIRQLQELLPTAQDEAHAEFWSDQLQKLGTAYNEVPSQDEITPIPLQLGTTTYSWGGAYDDTVIEGLQAKTVIDGTQWNVHADQSHGRQILEIGLGSGQFLPEYMGHPVLDTPYGVTLGKAEAIEQADAIVRAISDEYSLCFVGPATCEFAEDYGIARNWGWGMVYMRCINGFPSAYGSRELGDRIDDDVSGVKPYERMFLVIDDEGLCYFRWQTPMEVTRVLGADQQLLSFDEAAKQAQNMIYAHWAYEVERDPGGSVIIDKVKLGLCRIAKKGGDFYYVPAYFFFTDFYPSEEWRAQYHWDDSHEGERRWIEQNNGNVGGVSGYFDEYNAIVINALDGTLIDLGKGY